MSNNSIKDNFRTTLTPLHRVGPRRLHVEVLGEFYKLILDRFCDNTLRYAFSLIELSIVLIIIGLLVAGVTGGKSLIESAKTRALMNEIRGYKQAVNTFYVANDRIPGDANKDGVVDYKDQKLYNFPAPYANMNTTNFSYYVAPWVELYLDGIIDFKVDPNADFEYTGYSSEEDGYAVPPSKVFKDYLYEMGASDSNAFGEIQYIDNSIGDDKQSKFIKIATDNYDRESIKKVKLFQDIDLKMDDGNATSGNIISYCYGDDYADYNDADNCRFLSTFFDF